MAAANSVPEGDHEARPLLASWADIRDQASLVQKAIRLRMRLRLMSATVTNGYLARLLLTTWRRGALVRAADGDVARSCWHELQTRGVEDPPSIGKNAARVCLREDILYPRTDRRRTFVAGDWDLVEVLISDGL